jgi:hypothetical protein
VTLIDLVATDTKHVGVLILYQGALAEPAEVNMNRYDSCLTVCMYDSLPEAVGCQANQSRGMASLLQQNDHSGGLMLTDVAVHGLHA